VPAKRDRRRPFLELLEDHGHHGDAPPGGAWDEASRRASVRTRADGCEHSSSRTFFAGGGNSSADARALAISLGTRTPGSRAARSRAAAASGPPLSSLASAASAEAALARTATSWSSVRATKIPVYSAAPSRCATCTAH
jgi:hypothetical protein